MSGKSYTLREMKTIVEYLTEHRAYSETKGRKMWMDFAASRLTNRTWQSLKECFIKRILPDITNPYFKLDLEQIHSFKRGIQIINVEELPVGEQLELTIKKVRKWNPNLESNVNVHSENQKSPIPYEIQPLPTMYVECGGSANSTPSTSGYQFNGQVSIDEDNSFSASSIVNRKHHLREEKIGRSSKRVRRSLCEKRPQLAVTSSVAASSSSDRVDLTEKDKNKLEFKPVDEQQSHKDENGDIGQPSTSKANNEANATGEDTTCSKVVHNRASTETLILDNCYETVDDIRMALERSTDDEKEKEKEKTKPQQSKAVAKSVRDFIVYTEPLTPMLQEVLDDFATDESDPPMEIDENYAKTDRRPNSPENVAPSQSILPHVETETAKTTNNGKDEDHAIENDQPNNDKGKQADENESASKTADTTLSQLEDVMVLVDEALAKDIQPNVESENTENQDKVQSSHEASSVISDTLLPNNQEAVNDCTFKANIPTTDSNLKVSGKRKHSSSIEILESTKKRHVDTDQTVSKPNGVCEDKNEKMDSPRKVNNIENNNKIDSPRKKRNLTLNNTSLNTQTTRSTRKPSVEKRKPSIDVVEQEVNAGNDGSKNHLPSTQTDNPCLKSVSLYAEQFSSTKYSDVDVNDKEDNETAQKPDSKPGKQTDEQKTVNSKTEDVILLKSRSNSESHDEPIVSEKPVDPSTMKLQKDKNLASIFGFVNGGSHSKRLNGRKRTISHRNQRYESSESSDWTSASDSEYVSPPRGRRNRYARKYLKPHSARVRCLEDEGGLFVMLGNKIYPFVRDGKIIKNYLTYLPESDAEDDESYWKLKYVEEKKRSAELKKMVAQSKQNGMLSKESSISITPPPKQQQNPKSRKESVNEQQLVTRRDSESVEKHGQEKTVKIKFTKFDQEVQLEGHWQHLNPVLAQVVSMLKDSSKPPESVNCVELSSGNTTPSGNLALDSGVHEKVNKMESDIFKEIQEMDEKEREKPKEKEDAAEVKVKGTTENKVEDPNVTVRKRVGRVKKGSTTVLSPVKIKEPTESAPKLRGEEGVKEQEIVDSTPNLVTKRKSRTPRKLLDVPNETASTSKKSPEKKTLEKEDLQNEDEEIRYKFPSPPAEKRRRKSENLSKKTKTSNHSKPEVPSPEALSRHSVNSSQGYQDSDASPHHMNLRKKRRSTSTLSFKGKKFQRKYRSKSYPLVKQVSDSSNSSVSISVKTVTREQSTVNSEVYRSDSYQFLMPRTRAIMEKLRKIDETTNELNLEDLTALRTAIETRDNLASSKNYGASSSNVSMPSPELSMVESLSISKNALAIIGDYPSMEKSPNSSELDAFDKYLMSGVDVSMPLMGQECGLRESYRKHIISALSDLTGEAPSSAGRNLPSINSSVFKVSSISDSILDKVSNANIEVTSDSLDKRLEQLLLESVQKPKNRKPEKMEVDTQVKKKVSRKRCSTPNKKQTIRKSARAPSDGPLVEESSQTKCARNGRRSCPPSINIVYYENNAPENLEINIHDQSVDITTVTKRKSIKKDVIKVKILKPKRKPHKRTPKKNLQNVSRTSGHTEYDNESGVFLQGFDDSADLIHNHSDTCLQAKDCMGDSVEFLEMATKSYISINTSEDCDGKENVNVNVVRGGTMNPELFCDDAQCAVDFSDELRSAGSGNTLYFTPLSKTNSIITEDMSDASPPISKPEKSRPSKWYLVSEEETNYYDNIPEESNEARSFGSNLKQIFPITCAIPDLSTITEMSDKNLNSCSPKLDGYLD